MAWGGWGYWSHTPYTHSLHTLPVISKPLMASQFKSTSRMTAYMALDSHHLWVAWPKNKGHMTSVRMGKTWEPFLNYLKKMCVAGHHKSWVLRAVSIIQGVIPAQVKKASVQISTMSWSINIMLVFLSSKHYLKYHWSLQFVRDELHGLGVRWDPQLNVSNNNIYTCFLVIYFCFIFKWH